MSYLAIKHIHLTAVVLSLSFFLFRAFCRYRFPGLLKQRWTRITADLIDTVLLISAITLCILLGQYPLVDHWLTAKVLALVVYIVLGSFALKRGRTVLVRQLAFSGAVATAGYILWVAIRHSPQPWL